MPDTTYPQYSYDYLYGTPQLVNQNQLYSNLNPQLMGQQTPAQLGFNPSPVQFGFQNTRAGAGIPSGNNVDMFYQGQPQSIGVGQSNQFAAPPEQITEAPLNISPEQAAYTEGVTGLQRGSLATDPEYNITGQPNQPYVNPFYGIPQSNWFGLLGNQYGYQADIYGTKAMRGFGTWYDAISGNAPGYDKMGAGQRNTLGVLGGISGVFNSLTSGVKAAKGLFAGMGERRVRNQAEAERAADMARYMSGNAFGQEALFGNRYGQYQGFIKDGGKWKYQDGGDFEAQLSGRQTTGVSANIAENKIIPELEEGEFIISPDGRVTKVEGDTHENGGEDIPVQEGSKIISNEGLISKEAKKMFNVTNKQAKKMTFAELFEKKSRQLGMEKAQKEQEKHFKKLDKNDEKFQDRTLAEDENTRRFNEETISKNINKAQEDIDELQPSQTKLAETIYELQEKSKSSGEYKRKDGTKPENDMEEDESKDGGKMKHHYQDGGQEQLVGQIVQALQQGAQPDQIVEQLVQNGMDVNTASQLVEQIIAQSVQNQAPSQGMSNEQMKDGGKNEWVSNKIRKLMDEGRSHSQSVAIALSMWSREHGGKKQDGGEMEYVDGGERTAVATFEFSSPKGESLRYTIYDPENAKRLQELQTIINEARQNAPEGATMTSQLDKSYSDAIKEIDTILQKETGNNNVSIQPALAGSKEGVTTPIGEQKYGAFNRGAQYNTTFIEQPKGETTDTPDTNEIRRKFNEYRVAGQNMFSGLSGYTGDIGYLYPVDRLRLAPYGVPQYGEVSPIRVSPEYAVSEIGRATRAAIAAQSGMPGAAQSANISNLLGKQFEAINQATTQANQYNAQQAQRAQEFNVGQRTRASEATVQAQRQKEAADFARIAQDYQARQALADEIYRRREGLQREQRSLMLAQSLSPNFGLSPYGTISVNPYAEQPLANFNSLSGSMWYNTPEGQDARRKQLQYELNQLNKTT